MFWLSSLLWFLFLVECHTLDSASASIGCKNENGNPVDWWFIIKSKDGDRYAYQDSDSMNTKPLSIGKNSLNSTVNALSSTLHPVYRNKDTGALAYVLYNDEKPHGSASDSGAHAKGVLAGNKNSRFWLIHSVPRFPDLQAIKFTFPRNELIYGQSFLCISLGVKELNSVADNLRYEHLHVYETSLSDSLKVSLPGFSALISKEKRNGSHAGNVTSIGGQNFVVFNKSPNWGKDLGEDLVSPYFKRGFIWETWRRAPPLPSFCAGKQYKYDAINVESLTFNDGTTYAYTHDHSKWGIDSRTTIVCVGGINRMISQRKRGGGTVCFESPLSKALSGVISSVQSCSSE